MEAGLIGLQRDGGRRFRWKRGENVETGSQFSSGQKKPHKNSEKFSENPGILALTGILFCVSLLTKASKEITIITLWRNTWVSGQQSEDAEG